MKNEDSIWHEVVDSLRENYITYLDIAKRILLGEKVSQNELEIVKDFASDDKRFFSHLTPPYKTLEIDPDTDDIWSDMVELYEGSQGGDEDGDEIDDEYEDRLCDIDDVDFDDDDESIMTSTASRLNLGHHHSGLSKKMKEFGFTNGQFSDQHIELAVSIWNGTARDDELSGWGVDYAIDALFDAKVQELDDVKKIIDVLEKAIASYSGDIKELKTLRWRLADCYYVIKDYELALTIYEDMLKNEKGFVARPTLACQIINIKLKSKKAIDARDLMRIPKPSDYKITINEAKNLFVIAEKFLDVKLNSMIADGLDFEALFEEASEDTQPYSCFYRGTCALKKLKQFGVDPTFRNLAPDASGLKKLFTELFTEIRFLGNQVKDVANIGNDWAEDTELYRKLKEEFPHEEIVHHYRSPWLWKYQLAVYFPRRGFALDYRGDAVCDPNNYVKKSAGKNEYFRLYDRTMKKAESEYGIQVKTITSDTSLSDISSFIRSQL